MKKTSAANCVATVRRAGFVGLLFTLILLGGAEASGAPDADFRMKSILRSDSAMVEYVLHVADCSDVVSMRVTAGDYDEVLSVSSTQLSVPEGNPLARELIFTASGDGFLAPSVVFTREQGQLSSFSESFAYDSDMPEISFDSVSLSSFEGAQHLCVTVHASDAVDISELGFSISGIYAHSLREAGGIVEHALADAFARTDEDIRVYPYKEGQSLFHVYIPLTKKLSPEEIKYDGVVLLDAYCLDASGNRASLSQIAFTGEDIREEASNLQVAAPATGAIVLASPLETVAIIPSVDFQFRGRTLLPGAGMGVSYVSSHPGLIMVTPAGVVYPVSETGNTPVFVTVSYPGLENVSLPVKADFSKKIASLRVTDLPSSHVMTLPGLNRYYPLPSVRVVFDDGEEADLPTVYEVEYVVDEAFAGIVEVGSEGRVRARQAISEAGPAVVTLRIKGIPGIQTTFALAAVDALPVVSLSVSPSATIGENMEVHAVAEDDVGVAEVRFFQNGALVASISKPPYLFTTQALAEHVGQPLAYYAVAVDTLSQERRSDPVGISVTDTPHTDVPDVVVETPAPMQRCVEQSPVRFQVARDVGEQPIPSGVRLVEYYLDGAKIGDAFFPYFEKREKRWFEIWRLDRDLPAISTNETSLAFYAVVHGEEGGSEQTDSRLIRVVKNQPPVIAIDSPYSGAQVSVGKALDVAVTVSDDTLGAGTDLTLSVNDRTAQTFHYARKSEQFSGRYGQKVASHHFVVPLEDYTPGTSLSITATATDVLGKTGHSEPVNVVVKPDGLPSVSITHPVEGAHLVAGLPFEIRAEALDDAGVSRVDFYVDGQLVGSDTSRPFQFVYQRTINLSEAHPLVLHAVAIDTKGQEGESSPVRVTLGKDEAPPVVYIVSPEISKIESGTAVVVENSLVVFKVTGYDNVGAESLVFKGIAREGETFDLTRDSVSAVTGEAVVPQQIPGTINAFSALLKVRIPLFSGNGSEEPYLVTAIAKDKAGNASERQLQVRVADDRKPFVVQITPDKDRYFQEETVHLDVHAGDDRGVEDIVLSWAVDGTPASSSGVKVSYHKSDDFNPGQNTQLSVDIPLSAFGLPEGNHEIAVTARAKDEAQQISDLTDASTLTLHVFEDETPPQVSLNRPLPGSTLFRGQSVDFHWKAVDENRLTRVWVESVQPADGGSVKKTEIYAKENLASSSEEAIFSHALPASGDGWELLVSAADVSGNIGTFSWACQLTDDPPPEVTVVSPGSGSRFVEGESFTAVASVSDNRRVASVVFFLEEEVNGTTSRIWSKLWSARDVDNALSGGKLLNQIVRVPHRRDDATVKLGVEAADDAGGKGRAFSELELLDDYEHPVVRVLRPEVGVEITPGRALRVEGRAEDNIYVDTIRAFLKDDDGVEIPLTWKNGPVRKDTVKSVTIPNPNGFGTLLAGKRFYTAFQGTFTVPDAVKAYAGKSLAFQVEVADRGVNSGVSLPVALQVFEDKAGPVVKFHAPGSEVYEKQQMNVSITLTDESAVAGYRIYEGQDAQTLLKEADGFSQKSVRIENLAISVPAYDPLGENRLCLVVVAWDSAGNETRDVHFASVRQDRAPVMTGIGGSADFIKGGPAEFAVVTEDDWATDDAPVRSVVCATSLEGLDGEAQRAAFGEVNDDGHPVMRLAYPEGAGHAGGVSFGDSPYVELLEEEGKTWLKVSRIPAAFPESF